jgi:aspartyl-tRNA(Asn)/glutamyl-tRNA(Gln) amidotransferase subunit C
MARLNISAADVERYTQQLDGMLDHFADIDNLRLADVQPMTQPFPLVNVLRADVEQPCLDREEVLGAAPAAEQGRFRVPPSGGEDE